MYVTAAYLSIDTLHANGFMEVFVFGLMLGNKDLVGFTMEADKEAKLEDFIIITSLIMRIFIIVLIGSQVNFSLLNQYLRPALGIVLVFMFIARPLVAFACALPDRRAKWNLRELHFMCCTRETDVILGALSGILVGLKVPHFDVITSVTFMAILITILLQATTKNWLATKIWFNANLKLLNLRLSLIQPEVQNETKKLDSWLRLSITK